mgnify:CR=1 FL=1
MLKSSSSTAATIPPIVKKSYVVTLDELQPPPQNMYRKALKYSSGGRMRSPNSQAKRAPSPLNSLLDNDALSLDGVDASNKKRITTAALTGKEPPVKKRKSSSPIQRSFESEPISPTSLERTVMLVGVAFLDDASVSSEEERLSNALRSPTPPRVLTEDHVESLARV